MATLQFQGSLYRNCHEMLDAIAFNWLTGGDSVGDFEREVLAQESDAELTAECIQQWKLDTADAGWPGEDAEEMPHMMRNSYDAADLQQAFTRLRADIIAGLYEQDEIQAPPAGQSNGTTASQEGGQR